MNGDFINPVQPQSKIPFNFFCFCLFWRGSRLQFNGLCAAVAILIKNQLVAPLISEFLLISNVLIVFPLSSSSDVNPGRFLEDLQSAPVAPHPPPKQSITSTSLLQGRRTDLSTLRNRLCSEQLEPSVFLFFLTPSSYRISVKESLNFFPSISKRLSQDLLLSHPDPVPGGSGALQARLHQPISGSSEDDGTEEEKGEEDSEEEECQPGARRKHANEEVRHAGSAKR